jgi:lysophospholipase L1-like esterase
LIASVACLQTSIELVRRESPGALELFHQPLTASQLRSYERQLEERSVVGRALRPWFQFAQFAWLRDGGEKVLFGREDWLFYKPGCDDMLAPPDLTGQRAKDAAEAIIAWRDALADRGIKLLVMPAPNKESVYPDQLTRRIPQAKGVQSPTTQDLLRRLQAANVEVVDLFKLFAESRAQTSTPLYLAQDTHWSPTGVRLAARAAAQRLVEKGWIAPGQTELSEKPVPVERLGDLVRMLKSDRLERATVPEPMSCVQVVSRDTGKTYRDQPDSEVLVLGDSFLRIYQQDEPGAAGFIAHLARELGQPVTSLVSDGGASTLVRQELYRRPALLKGKRVVVWEFVERDIRLGTEGWQRVPLPVAPSAERASKTASANAPVHE